MMGRTERLEDSGSLGGCHECKADSAPYDDNSD
jgi:hypothetical protein